MALMKRIGGFFPSKIQDWSKTQLTYLNLSIDSREFIGSFFAINVILSSIAAGLLFFFYSIPVLVSFPASFILILGILYVVIVLAISSRAHFVEEILPDALQLLASNIKGGLATEKALIVSARNEFGPFSNEMKSSAKKIISGRTLETAFASMTKRINSKILERSFWLLNKGLTAGGEIADMLSQISSDLRSRQAIEKEIRANIYIYVILILFAASIGAPALLSVSTFIVEVSAAQAQRIAESTIDVSEIRAGTGSSFLFVPGAGIDAQFVVLFSYALLLVSSLFASLSIGVINSGKEIEGMKVFPLILLVSFAVFFIGRLILSSFFTSLI